jgi:hypothetical protein
MMFLMGTTSVVPQGTLFLQLLDRFSAKLLVWALHK